MYEDSKNKSKKAKSTAHNFVVGILYNFPEFQNNKYRCITCSNVFSSKRIEMYTCLQSSTFKLQYYVLNIVFVYINV